MSLRDNIANNVQQSDEAIRKKEKERAEYNMFRKIALDMARETDINIYPALKERDYKAAVHVLVQGTLMEDLDVMTGNFEIKHILPSHIRDSKIYRKFVKDPGVLVFKVTGLGYMVMFMSVGNVIPGVPRIVVYSEGREDNIYVMKLENYKEEFK